MDTKGIKEPSPTSNNLGNFVGSKLNGCSVPRTFGECILRLLALLKLMS